MNHCHPARLRGACLLLALVLSAGGPAHAAPKPSAEDLAALAGAIHACMAARSGEPPAVNRVAARTIASSLTGDYPGREARRGGEGGFEVAVLVDATGNARFPVIVSQAMTGRYLPFRSELLHTVRRMRYEPATVDGQAVAGWALPRFNYLLAEPSSNRSPLMLAARDYRWRADAGDLDSMATLVTLESVGIPALGADGDRAARFEHYWAGAIHSGDPSAIVHAAIHFWHPGCEMPAVVTQRMESLVNAVDPLAVMVEAGRLLEGDVAAGAPRIGWLLHAAAKSKDTWARVLAIGLLATHPDAAVRDAPFALQQALASKLGDDPDALEALAAAYGANGRMADAVHAEAQAIDAATHMGWQVTRLQERFTRYQSGASWQGLLCDCTRAAPWSLEGGG